MISSHGIYTHHLYSARFFKTSDLLKEHWCNNPDPPLADIVLFCALPQSFKMRMLGEGFYTLMNGVLFSSPTNVGYHNPPPPPPLEPSVLAGIRSFHQSMWDPLQIHPPLGPSVLTDTPPLRVIARRLAHRSVSSSDTICNDPDQPLANIILFGLSLSSFHSRL